MICGARRRSALRVGNHGYFGEMAAELREGGYAALLADLLAFDLEVRGPSHHPQDRRLARAEGTLARPHQGLVAGPPGIGGARAGKDRRASRAGKRRPCNAVVDDFIAHAERVGSKRRAEETVLARELRRRVPGLERKRGTDDDGCRIYNWHFRRSRLAAPPGMTRWASAAIGLMRKTTKTTAHMSGEREDGSRDF